MGSNACTFACSSRQSAFPQGERRGTIRKWCHHYFSRSGCERATFRTFAHCDADFEKPWFDRHAAIQGKNRMVMCKFFMKGLWSEAERSLVATLLQLLSLQHRAAQPPPPHGNNSNNQRPKITTVTLNNMQHHIRKESTSVHCSQFASQVCAARAASAASPTVWATSARHCLLTTGAWCQGSLRKARCGKVCEHVFHIVAS